jgi:hypothetical protein
MAAALSTVLFAYGFRTVNRLKVWAVCSVLMAVGAVLPSIRATLPSVAVAAVLVGGTFMIVTMVGLQEARARAPSAPAALIGGMTAASALGQILGPLTTAALAYLQVAPAAVLGMSLRLAASTLLLSAFLLWRMTLTSR